MGIRDPETVYPEVKPRLIRSKKNGREFIYTDALWETGDFEEVIDGSVQVVKASDGVPGDDEPDESAAEDAATDLGSMTKKQLIKYAEKELNLNMSLDMTKEQMLVAIQEFNE